MKKTRLSFVVQAGLIAAVYTCLTLALMPISFGQVQLRVSECLCVLPVFTASAIPGLFVGCLISNGIGILLGANAMPMDLVFGSMATLLAALFTYWFRQITWKGFPLLSMLSPVVFNGVMIGWELWWVLQLPFWVSAGWVALGELLSCILLGGLLFGVINRTPLKRYLNPSSQNSGVDKV